MQIDDLKGKNEPVTEIVEGVSRLKDEHGAREPGALTGDEVRDAAVHPAKGLPAARKSYGTAG